jgi:adenylate cyclase
MATKILVVDDETDVQGLMLRKFRREIRAGEFAFLFADDGERALRTVEHERDIDIVLSDINMPGMDGLTLLDHLGEFEPQLKTIMVSAYGDMDNIRRAMNRGAFDFVTKPIDFSDLLMTIKKTLDELDLLREAYRMRAEAEHARANLARYFAPSLVETLAGTDDPFGPPREQPVAVLFADIIGFTRLCASEPPGKIFALLRRFHGRMAQAVFAAEGTLDKFIGDGLMATFGTPARSASDATNALRCARAMVKATRDLNAERRRVGEAEIGIAIGIHYGPALLGNIGDERRLEFATIGDTVNLASRLEDLARNLDASIVVSDTLVTAIRAENPDAERETADLHLHQAQVVRGLDQAMSVWTLAAPSPIGPASAAIDSAHA